VRSPPKENDEMLTTALIAGSAGLASAGIAYLFGQKRKRLRMRNIGQARLLITAWSKVYQYATYELGMVIAGIESDYEPTTVNLSERAMQGNGAWGMMQVLLDTAIGEFPKIRADPRTSPDAKEVLKSFNGTGKSLLDPALGTLFGMFYLDGLGKKFKGDFDLVVAAYQQGPARIQKALAEGKSKEQILTEIVGPHGREYVAMAQSRRDALQREGVV
jgi:hypothetical protein